MRPQLQFSVPCLDLMHKSGTPSFQRILVGLGVKSSFPYELSYFYIVNGWRAGTGQHTQNLKFLSPQGNVILETGAQALAFPDPDVPCIVANKLEEVILSSPGLYRIQTYLDTELVLEYPLKCYSATK